MLTQNVYNRPDNKIYKRIKEHILPRLSTHNKLTSSQNVIKDTLTYFS